MCIIQHNCFHKHMFKTSHKFKPYIPAFTQPIHTKHHLSTNITMSCIQLSPVKYSHHGKPQHTSTTVLNKEYIYQ